MFVNFHQPLGVEHFIHSGYTLVPDREPGLASDSVFHFISIWLSIKKIERE